MTASRFRLFIVLFFTASTATAAQVTATFSGVVTSTDANTVTIAEVNVDDQVTGEFVFDSATADEAPSDDSFGLYDAGEFRLSVSGYEYSATDNTISVVNNGVVISGESAVDVYEVVTPLRDVAGPNLSGLSPAQIDIVIADTDATVFSNDSLPTSLNLSDFEIVSEYPLGTTGGRIVFDSLANGETGEIRFELTSIQFEEAQSLPMRLNLEDPQAGGVYSGVANIRGWALSDNRITRVGLYIDGEFKADIPIGGTRKDVGGAFPEYANSDLSGFSMAFNYGLLSPDVPHTIKVVAVDALGTTLEREVTINITKFGTPFVRNPEDVSLASLSGTRVDGLNSITLLNVVVEGKLYNVMLKWNTPSQKFEIVEITEIP